jgi:hypothetical protein
MIMPMKKPGPSGRAFSARRLVASMPVSDRHATVAPPTPIIAPAHRAEAGAATARDFNDQTGRSRLRRVMNTDRPGLRRRSREQPKPRY